MIMIPAVLTAEELKHAFEFCCIVDDEVLCHSILRDDEEIYRSWERETVEHDV